MADTAPTIPSLKESFISAQTDTLSLPLAPSRIRRRNNATASNPIPPRILDDVLFNLNQTIQLHQQCVYPPQATYNVAEQISNLYSRDAAERVERWKQSESNVGRQLDLTADDTIEGLPPSWPIKNDLGKYPEETYQYKAIVVRLAQLSEERKEIRRRAKIASY